MRKGVTPTDLEKIAIIAGERNITFAQALQYIDMFAERIPGGCACRCQQHCFGLLVYPTRLYSTWYLDLAA